MQWNTLLSDSLKNNIEHWKRQITNQELAEKASFSQESAIAYSRLTAELSDILLGPVYKQNPHQLYIVSDGILSGLPFGTLSISPGYQGNTQSFQDINYLVKTLIITYLPSANALLIPSHNSKAKGEYVGFAPSYDSYLSAAPSRGVRSPLLHNVEEVQYASKTMAGKAILGEGASKETFLQKAPKANMLHLALHAFMDEDDPMQSALFFSEDNRDSSDALRAFEIYALSLQADLTILSACQSGSGPVTSAEGVLSLGRAFQYAGCSNLLVTQWKMDDKASLSVMKAFFKNLNNSPVSDALGKAKLAYLEQEDLAHPYYWGGWVSVGKNNTISINRTNYIPWLLGCIVFIISILAIKKRKNE